jgi:hypothetical protein
MYGFCIECLETLSTIAMVYSTSVWWKKKKEIKSITVHKHISESITEKDSCTGMCVYAVFKTN